MGALVDAEQRIHPAGHRETTATVGDRRPAGRPVECFPDAREANVDGFGVTPDGERPSDAPFDTMPAGNADRPPGDAEVPRTHAGWTVGGDPTTERVRA